MPRPVGSKNKRTVEREERVRATAEQYARNENRRRRRNGQQVVLDVNTATPLELLMWAATQHLSDWRVERQKGPSARATDLLNYAADCWAKVAPYKHARLTAVKVMHPGDDLEEPIDMSFSIEGRKTRMIIEGEVVREVAREAEKNG